MNREPFEIYKYTQNTECTEFSLKSVPEFKYGKMTPHFLDCGSGADIGDYDTTIHNSFCHTFEDVKSDDVEKYIAEVGKRFEISYLNRIEGNIFFQFRCEDGLAYCSYLSGSERFRIIVDRCVTMPVWEFGYKEYDKVHDDTVFVQYSLFYSHMIKGTSADCGMNYILRLHDNTLVIVDGGEMEQSTDVAVADYMELLHNLTETQKGEKIKISLWICTHPHNDHADFMSKLILKYSDELDIERVMLNFPNKENVRHSPSISKLLDRLTSEYPFAEILKVHAGTEFSIANADFTVLTSNEDSYGIDPEDVFPNLNSESVVFTVKADGVKILFLADTGDTNGDVITENYSEEMLRCDFLQCAHHGINRIPQVYEKIKAGKALLPQCPMNMDTRFGEVYGILKENYGEENIEFADDFTKIYLLKDGEYTMKTRPHIGKEYDGSEW